MPLTVVSAALVAVMGFVTEVMLTVVFVAVSVPVALLPAVFVAVALYVIVPSLRR